MHNQIQQSIGRKPIVKVQQQQNHLYPPNHLRSEAGCASVFAGPDALNCEADAPGKGTCLQAPCLPGKNPGLSPECPSGLHEFLDLVRQKSSLVCGIRFYPPMSPKLKVIQDKIIAIEQLHAA